LYFSGTSSLFEFGNSFADHTFWQNLFFIGHSNQQGSGAKPVNLAGDAFGVIVNAGQGIIGKEWARLMSGQADMVTDIGNGLAQVERQQW
jgi:hypothetical protein